jgi:hypothetical protein
VYRLINKYAAKIVATLAPSHVAEYDWLRENTRAVNTPAYQARYRAFWQMNAARLSPGFCDTYFAALRKGLQHVPELGLKLPTDSGHGVKGVYSPLEVHQCRVPDVGHSGSARPAAPAWPVGSRPPTASGRSKARRRGALMPRCCPIPPQCPRWPRGAPCARPGQSPLEEVYGAAVAKMLSTQERASG